MRFRLIPREERFFPLFVDSVANALTAARALDAMLRDYSQRDSRSQEIWQLEHKGDDIAHEIAERLDKTFVTPFDREDIHGLASELDTIVDLIE